MVWPLRVSALAVILLLLSAPVFAATAPSRTPPLPYSRHVWRLQDGLPEDTVQAIQQTKDGYLWIGTTGGLARFDGSHFQLYRNATSSAWADDSVFCILADRDGSLWLGTEGGGLVHFEGGAFRTYAAAEGLKDTFVRALMQDHLGRIWIGTDHGLFRITQGVIDPVDTSPYAPAMAIHSIIEDRQHRVWVGGPHLLVFNGASLFMMRLPGRDSENRVKSILQTSDGTIWVGTVNGLDRLVGDSFLRVPEVTGTVRTLRQTSDGTLWAGTIGYGIYAYAGGAFSHITGDSLLPSNTVLDIFEDSTHQIWIGTQAGMIRLSKTPVSVLPLPGGSDLDFATISADPDETIWAVSSGAYAIRNGEATPHRFPGMPDVPVRNVFRDRAGTYWIGTDGSGVYHLAPSGTVHYSAPSALTNNFVRAFLQTRDGAIWVGLDEGVARISADRVRKFGVQDGLAYFSIRSLLEDHDGGVWIGTEHGLSYFRNGAFLGNLATSMLAEEKVWSILQDNTGTLWFGTRSNGLFRYAQGKITHYTTAQGLASNSIYQVLEDAHGTIWLSGPGTISSFPPPVDCAAQLDVSLYDLPYDAGGAQMYGGRQPSGAVARDGSLWFPSSKGALHVAIQERVSLSPPRVKITSVVADGRELADASSLVLPASVTRLEIAFAPLLLRSQQGVRFRYRLEGFEQEWTYTQSSRVATYTNVPAGQYRFHVVAFEISNPSATTEAFIAIKKQPHFYGTWWFLTLCLAMTSLAVWVVHQSRLRMMRLRFKAVIEERGRLAREMHDTVIQGCTSISALLEAISSLQREKQALEEDLLDHARAQVRTTIDEARQAVWNLRQKDELVNDLANSAAMIAANTSKEFGISVECHEEGRAFPVSGPLARELLMVVREAVYNAVSHAHAKSIRIEITYTKDELNARIADDGCGFDPQCIASNGNGHYGIAGMRERIARMGGRIFIESALTAGTSVSFTIRRGQLQSSADPARQI